MFLRCSGNNQAVAVLHAFMAAVVDYGIPEKVRSDLGGENVEVWRYMIHYHSSDRAVVVASTHNESVCGGMFCVISVFYSIFKQLEEKLDPLNKVELYCLQSISSTY